MVKLPDCNLTAGRDESSNGEKRRKPNSLQSYAKHLGSGTSREKQGKTPTDWRRLKKTIVGIMKAASDYRECMSIGGRSITPTPSLTLVKCAAKRKLFHTKSTDKRSRSFAHRNAGEKTLTNGQEVKQVTHGQSKHRADFGLYADLA